ncbi:MAG: T9SS type A sorting domain-containing protein, partial [Bacteroidota bacterium]
IPTGGILSMAGGGGLFGGEEIDAEDLFLLAYIPDAGGFGVDYDQFQFKVADADTFSDETHTVTITVQNPGSTQESTLDLGCSILQNPIREALLVQLGDQPINALQVVNPVGRIVAQQTATNWVGGNTVELAAERWPSGTYWLQITGEEGIQIIPFAKH